MKKLKAFFQRIYRTYFNLSNIVLFFAAIFCLVWTWGSISAMNRNWDLSQRLSADKKSLALLELEVASLELENDYYRSVEYQELAARRQQSKKLSGETMIYLPDNSEYAKQKHNSHSTAEAPTEPSNISQWLSYLFGV